MESLRRDGLRRFLLLWVLVLALQWAGGAYHSEGSGDPDEPAHIVTGIMLRDYVLSGAPVPPVTYARDYYLHYPKVAMGHWPPVFYVEQAAWTLLFPATRTSLLILLAMQAALLAMLVGTLLRAVHGPTAAWGGSLALLLLPGMLRQVSEVMTEIPLALLLLLALLAWMRYLDSGNRWMAALFGLLAAAAILAKATGAVVAGVPLLSVWLTGRTDYLRRPSFWSPAAIVLALCLPWYLLAPGALQDRVLSDPGARMLGHPINPWMLLPQSLGVPMTLLALLGVALLLRQRLRGQLLSGMDAAAGATAVCVIAAGFTLRSWQSRHVLESAPVFVLLAGVALAWMQRCDRRLGRAALIATALGILAGGWYALPHQSNRGYRDLVEQIRAGSLGPAQTIVVCGNSLAEGLLIAELAQAEPHPSRYVVRSTKVFANIDWMGRHPILLVKNAADVSARVLAVAPDLVVLDRVNAAPLPYQDWLAQALREDPSAWQAVDLPGLSTRFTLYRQRQPKPVADTNDALAARLRAILPDAVP